MAGIEKKVKLTDSESLALFIESDRIIELANNWDAYTTSDLQGVALAICMDIYIKGATRALRKEAENDRI